MKTGASLTAAVAEGCETSAAAGPPYPYNVQAYDPNSLSDFSNELTATTP